MTTDYGCDYCGEELGSHFRMRAVGFLDGAPLVKTWCGVCETPDDIDPEAHAAFQQAIREQQRQTRARTQKQTRADRMRKYDPTDLAAETERRQHTPEESK